MPDGLGRVRRLEPLDQVQGHVDPGGHPRGGDDVAVVDTRRSLPHLILSQFRWLSRTVSREGLVDKILEWRAAGPSPVDAIEFLDRLNAAAPESAFWAAAVSDSALREGLRADGRNPERIMADSVDAAGEPMRAMIGLPTELGDRYLHAAIVAGESAVRSATATEEDRQVLAQALTVHAERQLLREQSEGVRDLLTRAAAVLAMTVPQPADDDGLDALRAMSAPLRERLGPARPRLREGR